MTAGAGTVLVSQIMPIIAGAIARGAVRGVGSEDAQELTSEGCALAAGILDSLERRGKEVTPNNVAYYAIRALRGGRRCYGTGRTDVMGPATALCGRSALTSLDQPQCGAGGDEGDFTLHDALASAVEDPATITARKLDWDDVTDTLSERQRTVLDATAVGAQGKSLAAELKVSPPRLVQIKRNIGKQIAEVWDLNGIADVLQEPVWRQDMRAYTEKRAARYERGNV